MRSRHLAIAAVACVVAAPWARGQPDFFDQILSRYLRPKAAAGPQALHVVFQSRAEQGATARSHYFRLVPGRRWALVDVYSDGHVDVAYLDGALYVFRERNYSVHDKDGRWQWWQWPADWGWAPAAACRVGGAIWVFGSRSVAGKHRIRAARVLPKSKEPSGRPAPLGDRLELPARAADLCAVGRGKSALVFWHQHKRGQRAANEVWYAAFDGQRWAKPRQAPAPYAYSDFAVAEHGGTVWLFARHRGKRISPRRPLRVMVLSRGAWREADPPVVPGASDPWLDFTFDIEAASFDGTLYLFRACMRRVVAHRWRRGQWLAAEALVEMPPWAIYIGWWLLGNVAVCLVLLPVVTWCALRARGHRRRAVLPSGLELTVSRWPRRVAALLVDFLVTQLISLAALVIFTAGEEGAAMQIEALPGTLAVQVAIYFFYFTVTEGLNGQSLGKRLLSIAVIGRDGTRPPVGSIIIRNLFRPWLPLLPAAYLAGSILVLVTPTGQRLGDILANTLVVDVPRARRAPSA